MNHGEDENGDGKSQNEKGYENVESGGGNGVASGVMVVFYGGSCNGEVAHYSLVCRLCAGESAEARGSAVNWYHSQTASLFLFLFFFFFSLFFIFFK